jgi:glycosyltransferase involved in cell wall biosynthesis
VSPVRIAVWHNLASGCALRVLDDQIRGLVSAGHEVHVWTPPSATLSPATALATSHHEVELRRPTRRLRRQVVEAWRGRRDDLDAFVEHSEQCAREMSAIAPDVVVAHLCKFYTVPALAAFLDFPSVLHLQEPDRRLFEAGYHFPWVAPRVSRARPSIASVRRFVAESIDVQDSRMLVRDQTDWVHAFDAVLVNSMFSRDALMAAYGCTASVCPLGVDSERFAYEARPAATRGVVISVGGLVESKRPEFLVRAVAAAGATVTKFLWVGNLIDERCRERVERAASAAGVPFVLRQRVSDDELLAAYREADVFVYAPRLEPFGLAPLEANATGLPVVAVSEGGVRETLRDGVNGVVVEDDDAQFGAAIGALLSEPRRARRLGRSARTHVVENWNVDTAIRELESRLRVVCSR